jgi:hypothetical protein
LYLVGGEAGKLLNRWVCRVPVRFSLRAIFVFVALICGYVATWGPTQRAAEQRIRTPTVWGTVDRTLQIVEEGNKDGAEDARSPLPLLISQDEWGSGWRQKRLYYIWLFGPTVKLPFESTWRYPDEQE